MARDYKRKKQPAKGNSGGSPWVFLVSGFGLGLVAALVLYLQMRPPTIEAPNRPIPNSDAAPQSSTESEKPVIVVQEPLPKPADAPPSVPAPVKSEFDFYKELPDFEVVVPGSDNQPASAKSVKPRPAPASSKPKTPANYILQAGAFRKFVDADRRKAELAFKGIESNIQQVILDQDNIWYRVYVGPDADRAKLENVRSDLRRENIDAMIRKIEK